MRCFESFHTIRMSVGVFATLAGISRSGIISRNLLLSRLLPHFLNPDCPDRIQVETGTGGTSQGRSDFFAVEN